MLLILRNVSTSLHGHFPEALDAGREAERAFLQMKETVGLPDRCKKQVKRRVETRLKMTDPW